MNRYLVIFLLMIAGELYAEVNHFAALKVEPAQDEQYLLLEGDMGYQFSQAALEALDNGLPLGVKTEVVVAIPSEWFWDKTVWSETYRHEIQYHALSQQYLVKGLQSSYPKAFLTRSSALEALGRIDHLPLLELDRINQDRTYIIKIRTGLANESLPVPLRPLTYLSDDWSLQSEWKQMYWQRGKKK